MQFALTAGWADRLFVATVMACVACSSSKPSPSVTGGSGAEAGAGAEPGAGGSGTGGGSGGTKANGSGGSKSGGSGGTKANGSGGSKSASGGDTAAAAGDAQGGEAGSSEPAGGAGGSSGSSGLPTELWYAGRSLCAFAESQLATSGSNDPALVAAVPSLTAVSDVALDADGNVWVVGLGSDDVFRFPPAAFDDPEHVAPDLELQSDALQNPGSLTFDANGGLWVATRPPIVNGRVTEGSIMRFDVPKDATGTLALAPGAELGSMTDGDLDEIGSIEFDADNNLWVSALSGLLRFDDPTGITDAEELDPSAVIDKTGYGNNIQFYSVAFDPDGALWTASGDGLHFLTSVNKFEKPGSLSGRSSPDPAVTISGGMDLLPAGGIAFDGSGNLWFATNGAIDEYTDPSALHGSVNPDPAVTLALTGDAAPSTYSHLVFFPPPSAP